MSIRHILCSTTVAFMFLSTVQGAEVTKESITAYKVEDKYGISEAQAAYNDKDYKKAVKIAKKLAKQNNAEAQNLLGLCYESGNGGKQSGAEAEKWYQKATDQGYKRLVSSEFLKFEF